MSRRVLIRHILTSRPVAIFSVDRTKEAMTLEWLSQFSGIPARRLRLGTLNKKEQVALARAAETLSGSSTYLSHSPDLTAASIVRDCRNLRRRVGPLGAVAIYGLDPLPIVKQLREELRCPVFASKRRFHAVRSRSTIDVCPD